jgi:transcription termination factor NusB
MKREARSARHRSRRAALQALYSADLRSRGTGPGDAALSALDALAEHFELEPGARAFAEELVKGVAAERGALDRRLIEVARNWRLERMASWTATCCAGRLGVCSADAGRRRHDGPSSWRTSSATMPHRVS